VAKENSFDLCNTWWGINEEKLEELLLVQRKDVVLESSGGGYRTGSHESLGRSRESSRSAQEIDRGGLG
jgi:hypothetical protein